MTFRTAARLVLLAGVAGCDHYGYREPCEPDAAPGTCCPLGSHQVVGMDPLRIICAADAVPCDDAGANAGACTDGGPNAP